MCARAVSPGHRAPIPSQDTRLLLLTQKPTSWTGGEDPGWLLPWLVLGCDPPEKGEEPWPDPVSPHQPGALAGK